MYHLVFSCLFILECQRETTLLREPQRASSAIFVCFDATTVTNFLSTPEFLPLDEHINLNFPTQPLSTSLQTSISSPSNPPKWHL